MPSLPTTEEKVFDCGTEISSGQGGVWRYYTKLCAPPPHSLPRPPSTTYPGRSHVTESHGKGILLQRPEVTGVAGPRVAEDPVPVATSPGSRERTVVRGGRLGLCFLVQAPS